MKAALVVMVILASNLFLTGCESAADKQAKEGDAAYAKWKIAHEKKMKEMGM